MERTRINIDLLMARQALYGGEYDRARNVLKTLESKLDQDCKIKFWIGYAIRHINENHHIKAFESVMFAISVHGSPNMGSVLQF